VKNDFGKFYRAMFAEQVRKEGMRAVYLEYAWDMGWCDPCAADPLSPAELRELGVFWLDSPAVGGGGGGGSNGRGRQIWPMPPQPSGPAPVYITRLHVRYDRAHFPEDLVFQVTGNRENFQGRYIMRHPWQGPADCPAVEGYRASVRERQEREAHTLADLTGWPLADIRKQMDLGAAPASESKWWRQLWGG
jgi:hypothetical protein